MLLALGMGEGAMSQGMQPPLEAGQSREADSSLEILEGTQPYGHLDSSSGKPILDSWPPEL